MGSETSKLPERENQQQEDPNKVEVQGTRLYQYVQTQDSGKWELVSESATYGFYDQNEDSATSKTCWMLEVSPGDIDEKLTDNMGLTATEHERRVTFLTGAEDGSQIWAMRFPTTEEFHAFHESFENKHFENMYATDDREKALGEWSDVLFTAPGAQALSGGTDMMGWNAEMDSPRERPSSTPRRQSHVQLPQEGQISIVSMGAGARSFCVREATVDVLNNVRGGVEATGLSFECTPVKGSGGKVLTPSRLMLTNHERGLNALTKERRSSVFHTDIETGKVVSEWAFTKDTVEVPMTDICNDNKAAQLEDRDTFLGLDRNRLCRWDKRTAAGAVQDLTSELASPVSLQYRAGKDYSRNTNFSCINTSGDGFVVIGSDDGRVRFYNNRDTSLSRASTSIPSLGAAITHVDVTHDAQWVLATTDNYLMVIPTSFEDKKGNSTTGFQARMGPANVPPPRLLRLRPEDLAKLKFAKLEKARFTWETERGRVEKYIAATCGSHSIIWNFRQIKSHKPCSTTHGLATITDFYQVVEQPQSTVVDTTFMHENFTASPGASAAKSLVVATAHDVFSYGD